MSLIQVRKRVLTLETAYHEGGPRPAQPLRIAVASAVIANPYAGRYVEDIMPLMDELKPLGREMAQELLQALGGDPAAIEVYGKASIAGVDGELEHAALWHAPGGHALRECLNARGFVPSAKMVGNMGDRLMMPLLYINSTWARSHFGTVEVSVQDAPRPKELLLALAMGTGGRIHARVGGLTKEQAERGEVPA